MTRSPRIPLRFRCAVIFAAMALAGCTLEELAYDPYGYYTRPPTYGQHTYREDAQTHTHDDDRSYTYAPHAGRKMYDWTLDERPSQQTAQQPRRDTVTPTPDTRTTPPRDTRTADRGDDDRSATATAPPQRQSDAAPRTRTDQPAHGATLTVNDITLVALRGGTFTMGSPDTEVGRDAELESQRTAAVSAFAIGRTEITRAQYWRVMDPSRTVSSAEADLPVTDVSYDDAVRFCERLSATTGRTVRLPTEAEWEYASRAGDSAMFAVWEGDAQRPAQQYADNVRQPLLRQAARFFNFDAGDGKRGVKPVASFPANAFGLHDLHGNVWEWCDADAASQGAPTVQHRPIRGGGWRSSVLDCRAASRAFERRNQRKDSIGFRIVVELQGDANTNIAGKLP